jgi:hypothetical protein
MDFAMLRSADKSEGLFKGLSGYRIERDDRFPIRATAQFYRVTDTVQINEDMFASIAESIESVFHIAEAKGSLVIDTEARKTETTPLPTIGQLPSGTAGSLFSAFQDAGRNKGQDTIGDEQVEDFVDVSTF